MSDFNFHKHIVKQNEWSAKTFGPIAHRGPVSVVNHLESELRELNEAPYDLEEWADVLILSIDGAHRAGHSPTELIEAVAGKFKKNMIRDWPDWRLIPSDKPSFHQKDHARDALDSLSELLNSDIHDLQKLRIAQAVGIIEGCVDTIEEQPAES